MAYEPAFPPVHPLSFGERVGGLQLARIGPLALAGSDPRPLAFHIVSKSDAPPARGGVAEIGAATSRKSHILVQPD